MAASAFGQPQVHRGFSSRIAIIEANPGARRTRYLEKTMQEAFAAGSRTFVLCCDFDEGGPWSGVASLFLQIFPEIQATRPDLIERHTHELVHILPQLRVSLPGWNATLTDIATDSERVRSYSVDRAFRVVNGLVDLLDNWKSEVEHDIPWTVVCDGLDHAGKMSSHFFSELMRRRGEVLDIHLVASAAPGGGEALRASLNSQTADLLTLDLPEEPKIPLDSGYAAQRAQALETQIGNDDIEKRVHLPELIRLWRQAGRLDKVFRLKLFGLTVYLHLGLYLDAMRYGDGLMQMAAEHASADRELGWRIVMKLLNGFMGTQKIEAGLQLARHAELELAQQVKPAARIELWYLMAMLYARFQKPRDFAMGEEYLERGLIEIEQAHLSAEEYHFQRVFNRNGLAMIRTFQGRYSEALDLCQSGLDLLNSYVGAHKHKLHRSVLIYNAAQVLATIGEHEKALDHYSQAIAMDPNYSEYHNDRGNLLLALGRFEEARADYLKAIELGAPFFEVFTNLGQCYRNLEDFEQAVKAYSRALDIDPGQLLALLGRAQCHEQLGHVEAAMADYDAVIARDANLWEAIASRGVLHYELGNLAASLTNFNRALELAPGQVGLFKNRAIVLSELGRHHEAAHDLETALGLNPSDEERLDLHARLDAIMQKLNADVTT